MRMAEVRLQEGESLENALRRFKRKVMTEDIIKDVKRHSFYLKPGERRRVKQALAQSVLEKRFVKNPIKLHHGELLPPGSGFPFRRTIISPCRISPPHRNSLLHRRRGFSNMSDVIGIHTLN